MRNLSSTITHYSLLISHFLMTDVSVVILVGREELHIARCLEKLAALAPRQVFVVESQQEDRTHEIAVETGRSLKFEVSSLKFEVRSSKSDSLKFEVRSLKSDSLKFEVSSSNDSLPTSNFEHRTSNCSSTNIKLQTIFHPWPGNQAAQFQWALDNLPIEANWILRLDADEYLTPELIAEIQERLPKLPDAVAGIVLRRRHIWRDVWVKRGMYPTRILRLFRRGRGKSDGKLMDEHIVVEGAVVEFENDFVDHSLIPLEEWEAKHRNYARREAQSFLAGEKSTGAKGRLKWCYYHLLPSFARPAIYWFRRAIVAGAYFESPQARDFTWRHAFWYRSLVEKEIKRLRCSEKGVRTVGEG